jgi:hypothetical protein
MVLRSSVAVLLITVLAALPALGVEAPPSRYAHAFAGRIEITETDWWGAHLSCRPFLGSYACARVVGGTCHIFVVAQKRSAALIAHEIAHCNGWPASHPR